MSQSVAKSIFLNSLMFVAVLGGWLYYYHSTVTRQSPADVSRVPEASKADEQSAPDIRQAVEGMGDTLQDVLTAEPETTRVYKWHDASGKLHVSNTPPANASDVQVQEYKSNINIIPSVKAPAAGSPDASPEKTGQAKNSMEKRNPEAGTTVTQ